MPGKNDKSVRLDSNGELFSLEMLNSFRNYDRFWEKELRARYLLFFREKSRTFALAYGKLKNLLSALSSIRWQHRRVQIYLTHFHSAA